MRGCIGETLPVPGSICPLRLRHLWKGACKFHASLVQMSLKLMDQTWHMGEMSTPVSKRVLLRTKREDEPVGRTACAIAVRFCSRLPLCRMRATKSQASGLNVVLVRRSGVQPSCWSFAGLPVFVYYWLLDEPIQRQDLGFHV